MASEYKPNLGIISLAAASTTLNVDGFAGRTMVFNRAAGATANLPAATGSGYSVDFIVGTTLSGANYVVRVASASDIFVGYFSISEANRICTWLTARVSGEGTDVVIERAS